MVNLHSQIQSMISELRSDELQEFLSMDKHKESLAEEPQDRSAYYRGFEHCQNLILDYLQRKLTKLTMPHTWEIAKEMLDKGYAIRHETWHKGSKMQLSADIEGHYFIIPQPGMKPRYIPISDARTKYFEHVQYNSGWIILNNN